MFFFFATWVYLRGNLRVRLATQRESTQVQLASTCDYFAGPFVQGLNIYHIIKNAKNITRETNQKTSRKLGTTWN